MSEEAPQVVDSPLHFRDQNGTDVLVVDKDSGIVSKVGAPELYAFLRGMLQQFAQEREAAYTQGYNAAAGDALRRSMK